MSERSEAAARLVAALEAMARDAVDLTVALCELTKPDPGGGGWDPVLHPDTRCEPAYAGPGSVRVGVPAHPSDVPLAPVHGTGVVAGAVVSIAAVEPLAAPATLPAGADAVVVGPPTAPTALASGGPVLYVGDVNASDGQLLAPFVLYVDGLE